MEQYHRPSRHNNEVRLILFLNKTRLYYKNAKNTLNYLPLKVIKSNITNINFDFIFIYIHINGRNWNNHKLINDS